MNQPNFDLKQAHRWFAVECNNQAWDLIEADKRTADQITEMIHLAHSARYHWQHAGTALNVLRADVLLSGVYAAAGRAGEALHYAKACKETCHDVDGVTAFDKATACGAYAQALQLSNQPAEAAKAAADFEHAVSEVEEETDREYLHKLYPVAPSN